MVALKTQIIEKFNINKINEKCYPKEFEQQVLNILKKILMTNFHYF